MSPMLNLSTNAASNDITATIILVSIRPFLHWNVWQSPLHARLNPLGLRVPADPAPGHDSPNLDLAAPEVVELETLHLHLLVLAPLLPGADLLLGAVPLGHNGDVVGLAHLDTVLGVHRPMLALELGVADGQYVAGADHVVLLRRSI